MVPADHVAPSRGASRLTAAPPPSDGDLPRMTPTRSHFATQDAASLGGTTIEILHLTGMRSTKYGSLERTFIALARGCAARGWRLVVQYNEVPGSARYISDLEAAGATVVIADLGAGRISSAWRAINVIAHRRPRVVQLHFCGVAIVTAVGLLAHRLGVARTVATIHSMPTPRSRAVTRASYSRMDRVVCVSLSIARAVLGFGLAPATVVTRYLGVPDLGPEPQGVRKEVRERLRIDPGAPVIVTILFKSPVKGTDVLLDAFLDHLAADFPDLHLIVVGVAPEERRDTSSRADLLPDRLHWAGIVDDVRPFLAASDIYVQPSRSEGLGLAIMEAMRESLPVVATNVGGVPEVVADGTSGVLVEPDAPGLLAAAISRLLTDRALAQRFGAAGHDRWRTRFRLETLVELMLDDDKDVLMPVASEAP